MDSPAIDIGINGEAREGIANELGVLLADTYTLYLNTHGYHWNVKGPMFPTLHVLFEQHYNELWIAVDLVAERIRSLGHVAPTGYEAFSSLSTIKTGVAVDAMDMVADLVKGHEAVARTIRKMWALAEDAADQSTLDVLTQRLSVHEKTAWMLRVLLE
jgi:starvation-inducible DNA-binding protein